MVKVGDALPSIDLEEGHIKNKIKLSENLKNGYLIGVPAAFSPTCSQGHIPKYVAAAKEKSPGDIYVISVNDAFVMKAWQESLDPNGESGVHFVADPRGEFTKQMDLGFDATAFFGNYRSNRYAIAVKDGKVAKVDIEPDPSKVTVSSAENVL